MSKRDPLVLLEDIMLAIQKIGRYTSQMSYDAFLTNELIQPKVCSLSNQIENCDKCVS